MSTSRKMVKGFITHLFCAPLGLAITSVVAGLALVIARQPSTKTIRKLWRKKKKVYYSHVLECTWHTWGHRARWGGGGGLGAGS